jgi:hypothetical protein
MCKKVLYAFNSNYIEWKVQYAVMCTRTQDLFHNLKYVCHIKVFNAYLQRQMCELSVYLCWKE